MNPPTVAHAVQSCHELLRWLIPQLDKFPACAGLPLNYGDIAFRLEEVAVTHRPSQTGGS